MGSIKKCLKEWNAIIEALGNGKQTILVRKYTTSNKKFLLYPTVNYILKKDYIDGFQGKYKSFVTKNKLPNKDDTKIEIKYYAKLEKIIEKPFNKIGWYKKHYIWTSEHVRSYLNGTNPKIWILRIYKLNEPAMVDPALGIRYAHLEEGIATEGSKAVIDNAEFLRIINDLETI